MDPRAGAGDPRFLLREPVERAGYCNYWFAYPVDGSVDEIRIVGEGKLVELHATLSLDARTRTLVWQPGAHNYGEAVDVAEVERLVPQQAIENLWAWRRHR